MNARDALRKYFAEELDHAALVASLKDDDSLLEKGILDSIQIVKLTTFLEETFGITVGDDELVPENFETIASLARYVESKS
ncbi:MAG: acyl carrier protein [bacterium]